MSSTVTNVTEHVAGSELASSVSAAATVLPVINVNEFDQDGGYLNIGGTLSAGVLTGGEQFAYTYTLPVDGDGVDIAPEDGSGDLDLDGALASPYDEGESVYQVNSDGTLFVERWAYALEPDGEEELKLRVPHTLFALLPLGARDEETAEQVTFAQDGTDLVVTDVLGKRPQGDLSSIDFTTSPDGIGQRVEIDQDGIRLIDGTEDVLVNLPTDDTQNPTFTGVIVADGVQLEIDRPSAEQIQWVRPSDSAVAAELIALGGVGDDTQAAFTAYEQGSFGLRAEIILSSPNGVSAATNDGADHSVIILGADGASGFEFDVSDGWQTWAPTLTGWSANPTNSVYRYKQIGKLVHVAIRQGTNGTSNAATKSISLPVTAATIANMVWGAGCAAVDNGTVLATSSQANIASAGTTVTFDKDLSAAGGWTASGGHRIRIADFTYEAA